MDDTIRKVYSRTTNTRAFNSTWEKGDDENGGEHWTVLINTEALRFLVHRETSLKGKG